MKLNSLKLIATFALTTLIHSMAFSEVLEDSDKISYHLNDKTQVKKVYDQLSLKETWVKKPGGGMYLAKIYQDPTGTLMFRCDLKNQLSASCDIEIKKSSPSTEVKVQDEEILYSVELYNKDVVTDLWSLLNVDVFDHGGLFHKVLTNDQNDFSIFCMFKDADASFAVCKAQIIR